MCRELDVLHQLVRWANPRSLGRVIATAGKQPEKVLELQGQWLANVADEWNVDLGGRSIAYAAVPANDLLADVSVDGDVLSKQIDFDEFVRGVGRQHSHLALPGSVRRKTCNPALEREHAVSDVDESVLGLAVTCCTLQLSNAGHELKNQVKVVKQEIRHDT